MNSLLLHPLFLELRRRRKSFAALEIVCRPRGMSQMRFAKELKEWLLPGEETESPSDSEGEGLLWRISTDQGAFLSGKFTTPEGVEGSFSLESPDADCLGFELTDPQGRQGLDPLPEGNGLTYAHLWSRE